MTSEITPDFRKCFNRLPDRIKRLARQNYRAWKSNPIQRSLAFKLVGKSMPIYSIRVGIGWRALGIRQDDHMLWFWIGSHAEYDRILRTMQ